LTGAAYMKKFPANCYNCCGSKKD